MNKSKAELLQERINKILDVAIEELQFFETDDEAPDVDDLIKYALDALQEHEADIGNVKPKDR